MKNDLAQEQLQQLVDVTLPLGVVLRIANGEEPRALNINYITRDAGNLPAIGAEYQGGIFAGVSLENERPVALVLLPGEFEGAWDKAKAWAEERPGSLPSRIDQLVLLKNLKSEFKPEWYWSAEPYAAAAGYAWGQGFNDGGQYYTNASSKLRARAVRRLPIQ